MSRPIQFLASPFAFCGLPLVSVPVGNILHKPVPRWPDRLSYRSHRRDAAKRRTVAKGGAR